MKHFSTGLRASLALLLLGTACVPTTPKPITPNEALERAYQTHSFLGLKNDPKSECPRIDGWDEAQLFKAPKTSCLLGAVAAEATTRAAIGGTTAAGNLLPCPEVPRTLAEVQEEMERFCTYHRQPGRMDAKIPKRPIVGLARVYPDPLALALAGDTLANVVQPRFAKHFFEQVGRTGTRLTISDDPGSKVRLAFIDNHPNSLLSEQFPPLLSKDRDGNNCRSNHGDFLRLVSRAMTCDERGRCAAEISTRLALAYRRFDRETQRPVDYDPFCGGSIGNFEDLAQAIDDELVSWQAEWKDGKPVRPLILNLSLGWDGRKFGGLGEQGQNVPYCELEPGPRAVYNALEKAHHLGVLVFAAAGNDRLGTAPLTGPILPAAWERDSPGEEKVCKSRRDYPLVYAVGGLQSDGRALVNAQRSGAMPTLAAYADHAALGELSPWPTKTYTGTSVATAVVSSVAAMIWHENPDRSATRIVDALRAKGSPARPVVDFSFPGPDGAIAPNSKARRISLCQALWSEGDPECAQRTDPPVLSDWLNASPPVTPLIDLGRRCDNLQVFGGRVLIDGDEPCPSKTLADIASVPAVYPQPGNDPCPNCTDPPRRVAALTAETDGHVLYIEIDPDWPDEKELVSATFELDSGEDTPPSLFLSFLAPEAALKAADTREVLLPWPEFKFTAESQAKIHWVIRYRGTGTDHLYTSPVFIAN